MLFLLVLGLCAACGQSTGISQGSVHSTVKVDAGDAEDTVTDSGPKPEKRTQDAAAPEVETEKEKNKIAPGDYARAVGLMKKEKWCPAAEVLKKIKTESIRAYVLRDLAEAQTKCKGEDAALPALMELASMKGHSLRAEGARGAFRIMMKNKAFSGARKLLLDLRSTRAASAEDLWNLAGCERALGKKKESQKLYRKLALDYAHLDEGERAMRALAADGVDPGHAWRLERARVLMRHRKFDEAEAVIGQVLESGAPAGLKYTAHYLEAMNVFKRRHRYTEAAEKFRLLSRKKGRYRTEAAFLSARSIARAGDNASAVRELKSIARRYRRSPYACRSLNFASRLLLSDGNFNGAYEEARRAYRSYCRDAGERHAAAWVAGFSLLRGNKPLKAAYWLKKAVGLSSQGMDSRRNTYWLAMALSSDSESDAGRRMLEEMALKKAAGYYGMLALNRMKAAGRDVVPPAGIAASEPEDELPQNPLEWPDTVEEPVRLLAAAGRIEDAAREIRSSRNWIRKNTGRAKLYTRILMRLNRFAVARKLCLPYARAPRWPVQDDKIWAWRCSFPQAYADYVQTAAGKTGTSPLLLYSVMARESAFVPGVVSRAGARGLFQLMPFNETAAAGALGLETDDDGALSARDNVLAGAWQLKNLENEFNGSIVHTLAAYNAGRSPVHEWIKRFGPVQTDVFVEMIPYTETRNYVRRVIAQLAAYGLLYGDEAEHFVRISGLK